MSRFTGSHRRGAGRLERILRAARALNRRLDTLERQHTDTTDPEENCE